MIDLTLSSNELRAMIAQLNAELDRRDLERRPERVRRDHFNRWVATCRFARVRGLLKIRFECERLADDKLELETGIYQIDVMHLNAIMTTRELHNMRKPKRLQFQQVVPLVTSQRSRHQEIWRLVESSYQHEAAEMLVVRGKRIARTHVKGATDGSVVPP